MSLLCAVRTNDLRLFEEILSREGLPRSSKWSDYHLLTKTLSCNRVPMAEMLVKAGCRVNSRNPYYRCNSPLHMAVELRSESTVKLLLEAGARVTDKSRDGNTPLHVAFLQRSRDLVRIILEHHLRTSFADAKNRQGLGFLHLAAYSGQVALVEQLLRNPAIDVNAKIDPEVNADTLFAGYTPLHFAVEHGQHEVAEVLLSYGASIQAADANGSTPLHLACERCDADMIDLVLAYEESWLNCTNRFGLSHFMAACACSEVSVVEDYLRAAGPLSPLLVSASVTSGPASFYPNAGNSPLHFAAEYGCTESVALLLRLGANCCATNARGCTPVELARKRNHAEIETLIRNSCVGYRRDQLNAYMRGPATRSDVALSELDSMGFFYEPSVRIVHRVVKPKPVYPYTAWKYLRQSVPLDAAHPVDLRPIRLAD